jgi:hypothetical protein
MKGSALWFLYGYVFILILFNILLGLGLSSYINNPSITGLNPPTFATFATIPNPSGDWLAEAGNLLTNIINAVIYFFTNFIFLIQLTAINYNGFGIIGLLIFTPMIFGVGYIIMAMLRGHKA